MGVHHHPLDFEAKIFCEHDGESFRGSALANAVEKLLGDRDILSWLMVVF